MRRILTALVLIPPLLFILLLAPPWAFLILAALVAVEAAHEIMYLAERCGYRSIRMVGYPAAALLTASFYPGVPGGPLWVLLLIPLIGIAALRRGSPEPKTLGEIAVTLLGVLYAGLLTGSTVGLRVTPPDTAGRSWVFLLLAVVMLGDTGAYYAGRGLGRHKLAPQVSPNKTVEGLIGGLIVSVATAMSVGPFLIAGLDVIRAALVGLTVAILGVIGDLFESLLKRSADVKDTASILPGHGGILDRIDALLFASPALLLYVRFLH